jgi:hypothetical protein
MTPLPEARWSKENPPGSILRESLCERLQALIERVAEEDRKVREASVKSQ